MAETVAEYKRRVARAGGLARAKQMTKAERIARAKKAAAARWSKKRRIVA